MPARFTLTIANRGTPISFDVANSAIDSTVASLKIPATGWLQYNGVGTTTPNPGSGIIIQSATGTQFQSAKWETVP